MDPQIDSRFSQSLQYAINFQQDTETPDHVNPNAERASRDIIVDRIWNRHLTRYIDVAQGSEAKVGIKDTLKNRQTKRVLRSHRIRVALQARLDPGPFKIVPPTSYIVKHPIASLGMAFHGILNKLVIRPVSRYLLSPIYTAAVFVFTSNRFLKKNLLQNQLQDENRFKNEIFYQIDLEFQKIQKKKSPPLNDREKAEISKIINIAKNYSAFNGMIGDEMLEKIEKKATALFSQKNT